MNKINTKPKCELPASKTFTKLDFSLSLSLNHSTETRQNVAENTLNDIVECSANDSLAAIQCCNGFLHIPLHDVSNNTWNLCLRIRILQDNGNAGGAIDNELIVNGKTETELNASHSPSFVQSLVDVLLLKLLFVSNYVAHGNPWRYITILLLHIDICVYPMRLEINFGREHTSDYTFGWWPSAQNRWCNSMISLIR